MVIRRSWWSNCVSDLMIVKNLCVVAMIFAGAAHAAAGRIELAQGWKIRPVDPRAALDAPLLDEATRTPAGAGWLPVARMPAMVHDVLLAAGKIEEPWLPGRAAKCRWVAERDWLYAATFPSPDASREAWLRFAGLDTIVDVYLNGERIASHANMYTPLAVNISGRLRETNTIVLHFHTVFDLSGTKPVPIRIVGGDPAKRVRRPGANYSAYLGPQPYYSRVGVYDTITLHTNDGTVLEDVLADAALNDALTQGTVTVEIAGRSRLASAEVAVRVLAPDGRVAAETRQTAQVRNNAFRTRPVLHIDKPQLWWPRGYGAQPLYRVEVTLSSGGQAQQTERRTVGFRRIDMPSLLHFVVNGVPVRLWGGDWVTPRWQTAVWDQPRVDKLFAMAEHANFNIFRVWAEVESPRDDFYEMADARGFLLWQDFTNLPLPPDESVARCAVRSHLVPETAQTSSFHSLLVRVQRSRAVGPPELQRRLRGPRSVARPCRRQRGRGDLPQARSCAPLSAEFSPYYGHESQRPAGRQHPRLHQHLVCARLRFLNFASEDTRIAAPVLHSFKRFMKPEDLWPAGYSTLYLPGDRHPFPQHVACLHHQREFEEDRAGRAILRRHRCCRTGLPDRHGGGPVLPGHRRAATARARCRGSVRRPPFAAATSSGNSTTPGPRYTARRWTSSWSRTTRITRCAEPTPP